ncbi:MAG: hypothetical protein Q4A66_00635 [Eubacteriales bacterium]|nr:hypothetical protein [Eubacteriales bacterium]
MMRNILRSHFERYPLMQPQDAVKLCYQSEFGGGHMIPGREQALARLREEIAQTGQTGSPLLEHIGGYQRLYLSAHELGGLRPETIAALFCYTANHACGTMQGFEEKLAVLAQLAQEGLAPFSAQALAEYLEGYRAQGCPAVSHTPAYRQQYAPAYRLVPKETDRLLGVLRAIDAALADKGEASVAIDGMCGGGKSTFSAILAEVYDAQLFHMDDYFLPFARKTPERLAQPGGNVDYERFYEEIGSVPLSGEVVFRAYDCSAGTLGEEKRVEPKKVRIVEGSYSLHPHFGDIYDVRAWVKVSPEVQKERILARNGETMLRRFVEEWIPMENHYAEAFSILEDKNLILVPGEG